MGVSPMAFRPCPGVSQDYITQGGTALSVVLNDFGKIVRVSNLGSSPAWVKFGSVSAVAASYKDLPVLPLQTEYFERNEDETYVGMISSATAQTTLYFTPGFETR